MPPIFRNDTETPVSHANAGGLRSTTPEGVLETRRPEAALSAILDGLTDLIVGLDGSGRMIASNQAWSRFNREIYELTDCELGAGYFAILEAAYSEGGEGRTELLAGIRCVMDRALSEFEYEFPTVKGCAFRWLHLRAVLLPGVNPGAVTITHRDITARRKSEQELREGHALFRHLMEETSDGVFLYDISGRFVMCNSANAEAMGFRAAELIGRSIHEVFDPELARTIHEQNLLVLATGKTFSVELPLKSPRGKRTVLVNKGVYRNHRNEVVGIFGIARDITRRKQAEEEIEKSERRFRHLIENGGDFVSLVSEAGTVLYASPSSNRVLGYDVEELVGTNAFLFVHPSDLNAVTLGFQELLTLPGSSVTAEFRALHKSGVWQWMDATATNLLHDPSVHAVVINQRNINERKQAEMELTRLAAIIESSNDAIIGADPEGNIVTTNPAARGLFGYAEHELTGKDSRALVPPDYQEEYETLRTAALRGKMVEQIETVRVGKDGRRIDIALTLSPIRDRDSRVIGFSKIMRDITERRRLEKEILEISEHEKQRIGQDLHDDLCQHLVGISLLGNMLYEDLARMGLKQAEDARAVTTLIRDAVDHARSLARGLSALNLSGNGFMTGLQSLVSNTQQLFRVPCAFECQAPVEIPEALVANHLYRITQEALHNAVKHSGASRVVVTLEPTPEAIVVTVSDDGVGISEKKGSASGGGLGMHTMHYRARFIGASLEFRPNPQGGTAVTCRLPQRPQAGTP